MNAANPSSVSNTKIQPRNIILSAGLVLIIIAAAAFGIHRAFTASGNFMIYDFQSPLIAARAVVDGIDPYSAEVTSEIQESVYGRSAEASEDALAFAYPAYVAYLLAPLTFLPVDWAQAIWVSILLACALAGVFFCIKVWSWPKNLFAMAVVLVWSLLFYPLVWGLILGQIALVAFASLAAGIWATQARRDTLAGISLGLSLVKPNLSAIPVLTILIFVTLTRRFRLLGAAAATGVALAAIPLIGIPDWPVSFLRRLTEYLDYTPFVPPVVLIGNWCCGGAASWIAVLLGLALSLAMLIGWRNALRTRTDEGFLWAIGMTLIATTALVPRFATVNQVILILPAIGIFRVLSRKGTAGIAAIALLMVAWGVGLWFLTAIPPISTATPRYPVEHRILSPILPASMAVLWIWMYLRRLRRAEKSSSSGTTHA